MDTDKILQELFENDLLGLLNVKPSNVPARNEDERLVSSFMEIVEFFKKFNRLPNIDSDIQERNLFERLKGLQKNSSKIEKLRKYDDYNLLNSEKTEPITIDNLMENDPLGLLDDDSMGLFDLINIQPKDKTRSETDFVARRKPCSDFTNYEPLFKNVHKDLKDGKRKLIEFKLGNLREGAYYVHNGILFFIEKIEISKKDHYKADGTRVREDGRSRCIFDNGTESNMLKRSIEKLLYSNGQVVTENIDQYNEAFTERFSNISEEDKEVGFIYILKSKSEKKEIKEILHLYKIGYSKTTVEDRIKNAFQEPTYLMADVRIVMTYKCFNMNPQKLEQLLHNFFGKSCLNFDIFDNNGNRHTPREWFIAPLPIIEQAIHYIISGDIIYYRYDPLNEEIVERGND